MEKGMIDSTSTRTGETSCKSGNTNIAAGGAAAGGAAAEESWRETLKTLEAGVLGGTSQITSHYFSRDIIKHRKVDVFFKSSLLLSSCLESICCLILILVLLVLLVSL